MTIAQLAKHATSYRVDRRNYAHQFFQACLKFGRTRISADNPDREEIVHDAGWRALEKLTTLTDDTYFPFWLLRLLKNKELDYRRRANARQAYEQCDFDAAESAFTPADREQMCELAGVECRDLVSRLLDGTTLPDAAAELGVSVRTARRMLNRLKQELAHA